MQCNCGYEIVEEPRLLLAFGNKDTIRNASSTDATSVDMRKVYECWHCSRLVVQAEQGSEHYNVYARE